MEAPVKRKVTAKVSYNDMNRARSTLASSPNIPRAPSPLKSYNSSPATTQPIRPRAKVNTSATPMRKTVSGTSSLASPIVRSATPARDRPPISRSSSPARSALSPRLGPASRAPGFPRSQPQSVPSTPTLRPTLSPDPNNHHRAHHQSISFRNGELPEERAGSDVDYQPAPAPASGVMRIKAKLTNGAKAQPEGLSVSPSSASAIGRRRVHSISSNTSQSTVASQSAASAVASSSRPDAPSLYPITTSAPAANPHRYGSWSRASASDYRHSYQSFSRPHDESSPTVNHNRRISARVDPSQIANFNAKVDPTTIPLPPHSPPTSAVSFSSRSSISRSSLSMRTDSDDSASSASTRHDGTKSRSSGDSGHGHDSDDSERQERREAKSNRKIADLEITNKSLLAINASLEKTKNRQAKEIRDLRRKLRESRLILPPRAYRAVSKDEAADEKEEEEEEDDEEEEELEEEANKDEAFMRLRAAIDGLIDSGKRALESKPEVEHKTTKVLSAEEVQSWRVAHGDEDGPGPDDSFADDSFSVANESLANDSITTMSEDEVEAMTAPSRSVTPDTRPPILVTTPPL
ncbi:hypothetical protein K525DRAFT_262916 [Schizophyllum commune Loenen D]|nr:hypothetical protein K525DRAFT_262916 [Schizophyllum commune Loenen D]